MIELVLAALFLPISHFGISSTPLRAALVGRIGERAYLGLSTPSSRSPRWSGWARSYPHAETSLL